MRKKIRDPTDFEWLKQCRFYWRDDRNTVLISICDVDFEYSFEYLGAQKFLPAYITQCCLKFLACSPAIDCMCPTMRSCLSCMLAFEQMRLQGLGRILYEWSTSACACRGEGAVSHHAADGCLLRDAESGARHVPRWRACRPGRHRQNGDHQGTPT